MHGFLQFLTIQRNLNLWFCLCIIPAMDCTTSLTLKTAVICCSTLMTLSIHRFMHSSVVFLTLTSRISNLLELPGSVILTSPATKKCISLGLVLHTVHSQLGSAMVSLLLCTVSKMASAPHLWSHTPTSYPLCFSSESHAHLGSNYFSFFFFI